MTFDSSKLGKTVIEPTLRQLGEQSPSAVAVLLALVEQAQSGQPPGLGIFQMSPALHRHCWDHYLAFRPDLASQVRGLASQRNFLQAPDQELHINLAYATALVWTYFQLRQLSWPEPGDAAATAALCSQYFEDNSQSHHAAA